MSDKLKKAKQAYSKKSTAKLNSVSFASGSENNRVETRVNVEQIENGFLIIKSREGKDKKGNWFYETKKWFSPENPLEIATEDKTLADLFD